MTKKKTTRKAPCKHQFIKTRELEGRTISSKMRPDKFGAEVVCANGCGDVREVWNNGEVIKKQYAKEKKASDTSHSVNK